MTGARPTTGAPLTTNAQPETGARRTTGAPPETSAPLTTSAPPETGALSETEAERRRRRAQFLRELTEARELRARIRPRHARAERMRQAMRMRTFRW